MNNPNTMLIENPRKPGSPLRINETDYDPSKHKVWSREAAREATQEVQAQRPRAEEREKNNVDAYSKPSQAQPDMRESRRK